MRRSTRVASSTPSSGTAVRGCDGAEGWSGECGWAWNRSESRSNWASSASKSQDGSRTSTSGAPGDICSGAGPGPNSGWAVVRYPPGSSPAVGMPYGSKY